MGLPLMEVYQIIYLGNDELQHIDQIGTIKLISGHHVEYIYNVKEVMPWKPSIKFGGQIMFTVEAPTPFSSTLYIEFDLFRGAYKGTVEVGWENTYNVVSGDVSIESQDGTGHISLHYGLMRDATVAEFEVQLLDTSSCGDVYGVVTASNSKAWGLPLRESLLFLAEADDGVYVDDDDGIIPLSKSRVAVPMGSILSLKIILNCDGEEYSAKLKFDAQEKGESVQFNNLEAPMIRVKVTWDTWDADRYSNY